MKRGLEANTAGFTVEGESAPTGPRWQPPAVEEIAASFPELDVLELIGRGGMGAVYKARERHLDRLVALKILPPEIGRDAAFAQRFTREAQALARLNHTNIVTIYSFGRRPQTAGGELYFFIMEYVDGLSLRQLLDSGQVTPKEALAIVPQICEALQYAHDRGIVHRDIKPENILLNRAGQVKIADFGLAKLVGGAHMEPPPSGGETPGSRRGLQSEGTGYKPVLPNAAHATEAVMGTPQYMAPEQTDRPGAVDHRADIYSLGVVFYQMLTGELPVGRFEPPSRKVTIDVRLDEVVLRALEREPDLRYQQASEVQTQVETIVSTPPAMPISSAGMPPAEAPPPAMQPTGRFAPILKWASDHPGWLMFAGALLLLGGPWLTFISWHDPCEGVYLRPIGVAVGILGFILILLGLRNDIVRRLTAAGKTNGLPAPASPPASAPPATTAWQEIPRLSRPAVIGVIWAVFCALAFFLYFFASSPASSSPGQHPLAMTTTMAHAAVGANGRTISDRHVGPDGWQIACMVVLGGLGLTAPFGTTICGCVGISQIRFGRGRIYGLPLAVFDAVLFPLIVLDVLLGWGIHEAVPQILIWIIVVALAVTDLFIIRWAWSKVKAYVAAAPPATPNSPTGQPIPPAQHAPPVGVVSAEAARGQVKGPAMGLIVTAVINWLAIFAIVPLALPSAAKNGLSPHIFLLIAAILAAGSAIILVGGLKMKHLESLGLARLASVLAMIVGPGYIVGWPVGIWALVVLGRREITDAFGHGLSSGAASAKTPLILHIIRWAARINGTLWLLVLAVFVLGEGSPPIPAQPALVQIEFAAMLLWAVAFIIGWRREGWAALLILTAALVFHVVEGRAPLGLVLEIPTLIGLLYACCWFFSGSATAMTQPARVRPWGRTLLFLGIAVAVALGVRAFVLDNYRVESDAVAPEIPNGSRVFVYKLARTFSAGDVILYHHDGKNLLARVDVPGPINGYLQVERRGEPLGQVFIADVIGRVVLNTRAARTPNEVRGQIEADLHRAIRKELAERSVRYTEMTIHIFPNSAQGECQFTGLEEMFGEEGRNVWRPIRGSLLISLTPATPVMNTPPGRWAVHGTDQLGGVEFTVNTGAWPQSNPEGTSQPADAGEALAQGFFAPPVERELTIDSTLHNSFLDLDTGRLLTPPKELLAALPAPADPVGSALEAPTIRQWMRDSGADLVIQTTNPPILYQADGCVGPLTEPQNKKPATANIDSVSPAAVMEGVKRWPRASEDAKNPLAGTWYYEPTCVSGFQTREGAIGALEITQTKPNSVKVRYKLLHTTPPTSSGPSRAPADVAAIPTTEGGREFCRKLLADISRVGFSLESWSATTNSGGPRHTLMLLQEARTSPDEWWLQATISEAQAGLIVTKLAELDLLDRMTVHTWDAGGAVPSQMPSQPRLKPGYIFRLFVSGKTTAGGGFVDLSADGDAAVAKLVRALRPILTGQAAAGADLILQEMTSGATSSASSASSSQPATHSDLAAAIARAQEADKAFLAAKDKVAEIRNLIISGKPAAEELDQAKAVLLKATLARQQAVDELEKARTAPTGPTSRPALSPKAQALYDIVGLEQKQLDQKRALYDVGRIGQDEVRRQELKVVEAKMRLVEAAEPAGSPAVAAARLDFAKLALKLEQQQLDVARARYQAGQIPQDEVARQEVEVVKAKARLAELEQDNASAGWRIEGGAFVGRVGGSVEVVITVIPETLAHYGATLADVTSAIQQALGQLTKMSDLGKITIPLRDGKVVRLSDIATITQRPDAPASTQPAVRVAAPPASRPTD